MIKMLLKDTFPEIKNCLIQSLDMELIIITQKYLYFTVYLEQIVKMRYMVF